LRHALLVVLLLAGAREARAADKMQVHETDSLFLDMSKLNLGTITSEDDKKKYIYTIQLEKARVTRKTLRSVYDNAFEMYKAGNYEAANDLTRKILSIDPSYQDAAILNRASIDLKGSTKPRVSEKKLLEERFEEGMALYRQGRLVEAAQRWEECYKLSPSNLKAYYWLKKVRGEMADDHYRKGRQAYRQHRLREALDQWYAALVLNPRYPRLTAEIAKVEAESRDQDANEKLQTALNLYSQGLVLEALKMLDVVLEAGPGNMKAQKLQAEIRAEVANQRVAEGRRFYESRAYEKAIAEWRRAVEYGYDPKAAEQLVARAKEQMRREEIAKKQAIEAVKQKEEDAKKQKAEEDAAAAAAKKDEGQAPGQPAGQAPGTVAESNKQASQQAYLEGIIYYQKSNYDQAREKWLHAKQLDPGNSDAVAGLEKIEKLYGAGQ
jgi:tetratricopeptide (TPR) repeat protein